MQKLLNRLLTPLLLVVLLSAGAATLTLHGSATACGWGNSGGGDYVPQRRGGEGYDAQAPTLSPEQARKIVATHVARLNPNLQVGEVVDAGRIFEAEILSANNEIVQLLGVDKFSGQLLLLN